MAETKVVVVTGATGFVGKRLVSRLTNLGYQVVPISRKLGLDICSKETLENIGPFDYMIHLAARTFVPDSYSDIEKFFLTNVLGTLNCLELCRNSAASMSFASSYVYGPPAYLPIDELHPVNPWNPYAVTKIMAEDLCKMYSQEFDVPTSIFRIFNIYGPGQKSEFLIPKIIEGINRGSLVLETSTPSRDFVFVDDAIEALLIPLKQQIPGNEIFNVGSGESYSVDEVVRKVVENSGKSIKLRYLERERRAEIPDVIADISRLSKFGWKPKTSLDEGLILCSE